MNAKEKWGLPEKIGCFTVLKLKPGCCIPEHAKFFTVSRKVARGLEEHLVSYAHDFGDDHDFTKTYFYQICNSSSKNIYVKFEKDIATFGSAFLYSAYSQDLHML